MKSGIYKFTSKTTGLSYIGKSVDIQRRYKDHKRTDDGYSFHNAIKEHGWEDFTFEILEYCEIEQLNERERYWIAYYDTYHHGYNETPGGEGSPTSGKRKSVAQYDLNGNFIAIYDSILEAERQLNLKPKSSNISGVCTGKHYEDHGYQWRYLDQNIDYKLNIGKSLRHEKCQQGALNGLLNGQSSVRKIAKCDKSTKEIIKEYNSIKEASEENKIHFSCIYRVCSGERKSAGGYYWKYI